MTAEWVPVLRSADLAVEDVARVDVDGVGLALYRDASGALGCTDVLCTHGRVPLSDGFVFDREIECPKHNGRFDVHTGEAARAPATAPLRCHPIREVDGWVEVQVRR